MNNFLRRIREPMNMPISRNFLYSLLILIAGILLGVISKVLDETASNELPYLIDVLDLRNFFSRMGVWIFLAVLITIYSKSPARSAINVLLFFAGMVSSYFLYTINVAGFYPKSYMMIWMTMTVISPFLAFICWYAKGKGSIAIFISSVIFMFISRQTFAFGFWYFDISYFLEFLLLIVTVIVLYQSPKQIIKVVTIGMLIYLLTAQANLFWGIL